MSTKNLARTVIEGGRHVSNKWDRRNSHAEVRAQERDWLKAVARDPELADEDDIDDRQPVMKGFTDKLAPMYRWLKAQVGRPWSEVRSEVFQKFDTRTTAGRHITFDHLLREVVETESGFDNRGHMANPSIEVLNERNRYHYFSDYYVDENGILCKPELDRRAWRSHYRYQLVTEEEFKQAEKWLANRMVLERDGKYYWGIPTQGVWKATWFEPQVGYNFVYDRYTQYDLKYYHLNNGAHEDVMTFYPSYDAGKPHYFKIKTHGDYWEVVENPYSFRQRGELSPVDLKAFKSMKKRLRQDILEFGKGR